MKFFVQKPLRTKYTKKMHTKYGFAVETSPSGTNFNLPSSGTEATVALVGVVVTFVAFIREAVVLSISLYAH